MNSFEEKLRDALRREPAPEGFAEEVLARTREISPPVGTIWWRFGQWVGRPAFRWALAAVAACLLVAVGAVHHQRQERLRREGEMARVQVEQALRIASVKLNVARKMVLEIQRTSPQGRL